MINMSLDEFIRRSKTPVGRGVARRAAEGPRRTGPRAAAAGQTRLQVRNVPLELSGKELLEVFARFGPLSRCKLHSDELGRSRGSATVQFEQAEHAAKAVEQLHNKLVDGRTLTVEAVPPAEHRERRIAKPPTRPSPTARGRAPLAPARQPPRRPGFAQRGGGPQRHARR